MEFRFDSDILDLRDGAREYLRDRCTAEALRGLVEAGIATLGCWDELVEMGFVGFCASEESGGLSLPASAFALLAEEAGYVALPEPLVDVAGIGVPTLAQCSAEAAAAVVAGEYRVLSSHALNPWVNQLQDGDRVLTIANDSVALLSSPTSNAAESIDPLRRLSAVEMTGGDVLASGDAAASLATSAAHRGAVFSAAELLGLSAAMIDVSRDYVVERKQFGVAIGTFQAVKHHLSTAFTKLEFARPVVYRAAAMLDTDDTRVAQFVAHAKIAATDAAINAAEAAIQVHGGIGYTFEADLHLWMKRAWALAGLWGDRNHHMAVVEDAVLGGEMPLGPSATFAN